MTHDKIVNESGDNGSEPCPVPMQGSSNGQDTAPVYDLSKLPCCGAHVLKLRTVSDSQFYCHKCGKDIPAEFMAQMEKADPRFRNTINEAIRTANQLKPDVDVVLQKKILPPPDDPKYKQQQAKIDAFLMGVKAGSDRFALCPYVEGTPAYTEWHRGHDKAPEVMARMKR